MREQHFGIAEGKAWAVHADPDMSLEEHYAKGIFPILYERHEKFPEGESLDDLAVRTDQAVREVILPEVWKAAREGVKGIHIAVVSHGLCISEMVPALLRKDASGIPPSNAYRGLLNTAWTRVTIDVPVSKVEFHLPISHPLTVFI